ncbi:MULTISPECIES: hypothetical protein [unclassified Microbacterium]|uniref:hypothetical protein n=1 Tax=unclassified Microbacterium TaxID=2609290 RepID=UPI000AC21F9F|nr:MULTISPECIES: hypothetical protein [unclassified Microbacterium]MEA1262589.1 hypothetical protein [Microbacterium sp. STF-2]
MDAGILTVVPGRALRAETPSLPCGPRKALDDRPPAAVGLATSSDRDRPGGQRDPSAAEGFTHPLWLIVVVIGYTGSLGLLSVALDRGMAIGVVLIAAGVAMIEFGGAH